MALDLITQKKILADVLQDKAETGYTPAESEFRKKVVVDVEIAKKNNWVIEVPAEWEI